MQKFAIAAAIALAVATMTPAAASASQGPSFSCRHVTVATERTICKSRNLSRLDRRLAFWYGLARERARYFDQTRWLRNQQRAWLRSRNRCGRNRLCLHWKYRWRIRTLRRYYNHV